MLTRWWGMRLKHGMAWLWEEQAGIRNVCRNEKRYCSCCIRSIRIDTILSKNAYINFKICFSGSCSPSQATTQTYFGNFTLRQTIFGAQNCRASVRLHYWQLLGKNWIFYLKIYTQNLSTNQEIVVSKTSFFCHYDRTL